jgi:hypothetical protein
VLDATSQQSGSFGHAKRSESGLRFPAACHVVGCLNDHLGGPHRDPNAGPAIRGMPKRVGQGFLDDSVGRQLNSSRQGGKVAVRVQLHL